MVKIVIIEDESDVRGVIKKLLSLIGVQYIVVGEATNTKDAKTLIVTAKPDIVLLDVHLKDNTGFYLLNQLDDYDFRLIFITSFSRYAVKAFKFNALDYILKPIDPDEFKRAITKAIALLNSENTLHSLLKNMDDNNKLTSQKLVVKTSEKTNFIPINDILYFQSDGSYTKIFARDMTLLASKNLKHYVSLLPDEQFIRTHKSYVVNISHIKSVKNNKIVLYNNTEIPIATRKTAMVINLLK